MNPPVLPLGHRGTPCALRRLESQSFLPVHSRYLGLISCQSRCRDVVRKIACLFLNLREIKPDCASHAPPLPKPPPSHMQVTHQYLYLERVSLFSRQSTHFSYNHFFFFCKGPGDAQATRHAHGGWVCWIRSLSDVAETRWDAGGIFCMPGHQLIFRPMSKPRRALPARYTHCCICALCYGESSNLTLILKIN
jgi:hypothetical protein